MSGPLARDIIESIRARRLDFNPWVDIDVRSFGVRGDNLTDNSITIANAYAALGSRGRLYFPHGDYLYSSALSFTGNKHPAFLGDGSSQSRLIYTGSNTTNDCITIGDGVTPEQGWNIQGIGFYSNTTMTGGAGVRLKSFVRSRLSDVHMGDQDSNSKFYISAWLDGLDLVEWIGMQARGSLEGLRVNGRPGFGQADLYLSDYKIATCATGVHIAGSMGGMQFGIGSVINCGTNLLIDKSVTGINNREITLGPQCAIDSACTSLDAATFDGINIDVQDTGGTIFLKGTWGASAGTLIRCGASFAGTLFLVGGRQYNAFNTFGGNGNGVELNSALTKLYVDNTYFENINATGITSSVATSNVFLHFPEFASSVVTSISSNITSKALNTYGDLKPQAGTTGMTSGFMFVPGAAGPPTGVPPADSGRFPVYWDDAAKIMYAYSYSSAAWMPL